jgi:Fibrinogen beta and gamma chains, C-terminal globular domain
MVLYPIADSSVPVTCMLSTVTFVTPVRSLNSWIVVQELYSTTFDWNRTWEDYKTGFGKLGSDYWFGLEKLYQLTSASDYRVRIEVRQVPQNIMLNLQMAVFSVASEESFYNLTWSGMSGDWAMITVEPQNPETYHNGKTFSTYDNNRSYDPWSNSTCPNLQGGGWWFNACYSVCLTCILNLGACSTYRGVFNAAGGTVCANFTRMMIQSA